MRVVLSLLLVGVSSLVVWDDDMVLFYLCDADIFCCLSLSSLEYLSTHR